jgi:hypothetical protein
MNLSFFTMFVMLWNILATIVMHSVSWFHRYRRVLQSVQLHVQLRKISLTVRSSIFQDVSTEDRNLPRGFSLPKNHPGGGFQRGASELEGGEVCEWEVEFGVQEIVGCTGRDDDHLGVKRF